MDRATLSVDDHVHVVDHPDDDDQRMHSMMTTSMSYHECVMHPRCAGHR